MPGQATLQDIATLRYDAVKAELEGDLELARQSWIRVLAVSPADYEAVTALERISEKRRKSTSASPPTETEDSKAKSKDATPRQQPVPTAQRQREFPSLKISPPLAEKIEPEDELRSEKGIDYTQLRDLLAAQKWKWADKETTRVMLKAAGREERGFLYDKDIEKFPCADLRTIDQLWVRYSNGRFGFSVQKRIWESVGGQPERFWDYEIYKKFGDRVGWRVKDGWILSTYRRIFSLNAPEGHLPWWGGRWGRRGGRGVGVLLSRRDL